MPGAARATWPPHGAPAATASIARLASRASRKVTVAAAPGDARAADAPRGGAARATRPKRPAADRSAASVMAAGGRPVSTTTHRCRTATFWRREGRGRRASAAALRARALPPSPLSPCPSPPGLCARARRRPPPAARRRRRARAGLRRGCEGGGEASRGWRPPPSAGRHPGPAQDGTCRCARAHRRAPPALPPRAAGQIDAAAAPPRAAPRARLHPSSPHHPFSLTSQGRP